MIQVSVIVPTHNPNAERLRRTLEGLAAQTLPAEAWELIVVDNASTPVLTPEIFPPALLGRARIVAEPRLGLSQARARGFAEARGACIVLVDDDNVLAASYLETAVALLERHPDTGLVGGKSVPEFERQPEPWQEEFFPLLALRDPGDSPLLSDTGTVAGDFREYPPYAPIGAGMVLREAVAKAWVSRGASPRLSDRRGRELSSGGDNDIVLCGLSAGWRVGYFPELSLVHLIPASRLEPDYLARLNRGIQKSWMQVLTLHGANPWGPVSSVGAGLRIIKAWFMHRPWSSPAARVRFAGARGHFEGRVSSSL
ncbi:putative glycosyl transferase [mine drainage metagenome]|uniref:Putative glycosyl transferase n=1 Tax=mine drainage metagenome TaxID=410659 RepID=A0A1J5SG38_9ZZZZ